MRAECGLSVYKDNRCVDTYMYSYTDMCVHTRLHVCVRIYLYFNFFILLVIYFFPSLFPAKGSRASHITLM